MIDINVCRIVCSNCHGHYFCSDGDRISLEDNDCYEENKLGHFHYGCAALRCDSELFPDYKEMVYSERAICSATSLHIVHYRSLGHYRSAAVVESGNRPQRCHSTWTQCATPFKHRRGGRVSFFLGEGLRKDWLENEKGLGPIYTCRSAPLRELSFFVCFGDRKRYKNPI